MRLRPRSPREMGDDWILPRSSGRATTIGNLDAEVRGAVDPAGLVTIDARSWSLDWWVGAEDRWHLPCREVAVRQSLLSGSPVVETRVRVPSGDAVHRAYAARSVDGSEALVIEVENQSKVPFAVALAIRPHTQVAPGRVGQISIDGPVVRVDDEVALVLPKSPGRVALSDAASGDSAHVVFAGDAARVGTSSVTCADGLAQGALLFPLAHTAVLRVVLPLHPSSARSEPSAYPSAVQVASGWGTHADGATRIEVPDRRLRDAVAASTRHLLLGGAQPEVASALDLMGFPREAARLLTADPIELARCGAPDLALHAVARHWELTRDLAFARAMADVVAVLVPRMCRTKAVDHALGRSALRGASALLRAAGEERAASDVRASEFQGLTAAPLADLTALLSGASTTWTWPSPSSGHDLARNAAIVTHVREQLVVERDDGLALSPVVGDMWLGQAWELHDAPTRHGLLSFAVRWHGDRPALLWDRTPHFRDEPVWLTAPGLDPTWSTLEHSGEALLAPIAIPDKAMRRGLSIPVSIEPMPRRPT